MSQLFMLRTLPVEFGDDLLLAVCTGPPIVALGDTVAMRVVGHGSAYFPDVVVWDILVAQLLDTPQEYLEAFECSSMTQLRKLISVGEGYSLPAETLVHFVVLGDSTAEKEAVISVEDLAPEYEHPFEELIREAA